MATAATATAAAAAAASTAHARELPRTARLRSRRRCVAPRVAARAGADGARGCVERVRREGPIQRRFAHDKCAR
ncbi:hypothetical protein WT60_29380 [Burkholderia sp. MSMB617WGS]|nr:hypothetical protein WS78_27590 [Burkholderia savannae]AOK50867.1 hypothetical protein WT60_29380 [Burkholderia sp. MSMB617WGS]KVG46200.1 hypothetical protein WS77_31105 [Burkholderia sp. MSMB0265]KVG89653.1 hypothetical protein WS81_21690 [Burkholderia sp. MSMB2040]KVG91727.1 hypothetical protein WS82_14040 [Burkholderia sp. MSMB2041]KVH00887.1 hypothetical protein WS83_21355 [Burkholderia sp. MSMB2042]